MQTTSPPSIALETLGTVPLTPFALKEWTVCVDGVAIKQIALDEVGHMVKQHRHPYDHHTMLATGSVRVWVGEKHLGDFTAPRPIFIKAGEHHSMMALEDNTLIYCFHNLHGGDDISILAEE